MIKAVIAKNISFLSNIKSKAQINSERINLNAEELDTFVKMHKEQDEQNRNSKISILTGSLTAGLACLAVYVTGLSPILLKIKKNPISIMNDLQKKAFISKNLKSLLLTTLASVGCYTGLTYWHNKNIDKATSNTMDRFNKLNTFTSAKFADDHFRSSLYLAKYNTINGEIEFNKDLLADPIRKMSLNKIIKHELEHARQFEMIAALDDGIEKLNYAVLKNSASNINDDEAKEGFLELNECFQSDKTGLFDNVSILFQGAEVDMKKYYNAMATLLHNPNATYKDIPIVIDKEHYLKAIEKRGPLSREEKEKAEEYYQAYLEYDCSASTMLNFFSKKYKENILEKEAVLASKK